MDGAATLLLVGKYLLPIFLKYQVRTLPEFLRQRFGARLQLVMAMLWIGIYVFVALTAILWLGATAVHAVTDLTMGMSLVLLGLFAGNYALYVGLKTASYTDLIQVAMLVAGGLAIAYFALVHIAGGGGLSGVVAVCLLGFLWQRTTEAGPLVAVIGSPLLSTGFTVFLPAVPFMNRMLYVFLIVLVLAVAVSQMQKLRPQASVVDVNIIDFSSDAVFNIGAFAVVAILAALYAARW